jgi:hypothetical protein
MADEVVQITEQPNQLTLAFQFAGVGTVTWTPDGDHLIVGAIIAGGSAFLLASDPNMTPGDLSSPGSTGRNADVLFYGGQTIVRPQLRIPVSAGKNYFVSCTNVGTLLLYLIPA